MAKIDYLKDPLWGAHAVRHHILVRVRDPGKRRWLSRMFARLRPRPLPANSDTHRKASELERDGFVFLDQPFSPDLLARVRDQLSRRECYDGYRPELGNFMIDAVPPVSNTVYVRDVETLPEVIGIANDPFILRVVSEYFGCKPIINDIEAWWSLPGREKPHEAQYFHRDDDAIRFVKLFIYLTDVGDGDGPHVFVRGSHRSRKLLDGGVRRTDEEVAASHDASDIRRFTGPAGTVFLEDTYGLHKGELPRDNPRLILQVRYTLMPSMFVKKGSKKANVEGYDSYVNRWLKPRSAAA